MTLPRSLCPKPRNFIPAGDVQWAQFAASPPPFMSRPQRLRGARAEGKRYERKAQEYLLQRFPTTYVPGPWLIFANRTGRQRWCQPDGLLIDLPAGLIVVVEIKLKHTGAAWWQVERLYTHVLRRAFRAPWRFAALEVVRWFDPHVHFPPPFNFCADPGEVTLGSFGVHIWKGR